MLKSSYFADMKSQVGRYVDHDAAIEESFRLKCELDSEPVRTKTTHIPGLCRVREELRKS
jgi:hypothetical protein